MASLSLLLSHYLSVSRLPGGRRSHAAPYMDGGPHRHPGEPRPDWVEADSQQPWLHTMASFILFSISKLISVRLGSWTTPGISLNIAIIMDQFTSSLPTRASTSRGALPAVPTEGFPRGRSWSPLGSCPCLTSPPTPGAQRPWPPLTQGGCGRAFKQGQRTNTN